MHINFKRKTPSANGAVVENSRSADLPTILGLLKEEADWLASKKINQWSEWVNPTDGFVKWIKNGIDANEFSIVMHNDTPVGTFRLQWSDDIYWRGFDHSVCGYVHSLTVRRKYSGLGIGVEMLHMAEADCLVSGRTAVLRLDCDGSNANLLKYYVSIGFSVVQTRQEQGGYIRAFLKRPLQAQQDHMEIPQLP